MARDPSPFSQRLKALAVRAGLPVDAGASSQAPATPASAPDDEQPTGEFAAASASGTPDDDQPTGEFPVISEVPAAEEPSPVDSPSLAETDAVSQPEPDSAPEPEPSAAPESDPEPSAVDHPVWQTAPVPPPVRGDAPAPPPSPIWTDSPPETQSPLGSTGAASDGPTLPPPTLSKSAELNEALALPDHDDELSAPAVEAPPTEPAIAAESQEEQPTIAQPAVGSDATPDPPIHEFSPITVVADQPVDAPADPTDASPDEPSASTDEPASAADASADDAPAPDETPPAPDETPKTSARERLSLTGRFAALKRRVAPPADQPDADASAAVTDAEAGTTASASAAGTEATPPEPPSAPVPAPTPAPVHVYAAPAEPPPVKPSFSERAALRRRVKTLRARRDTGLLELGAIVLDQRRFGDPTAGALLRRRTDELGDLDNEIAAIEHVLDDHASTAAVAALGTIRCVGCGSLVGPGDRFCVHCGVPRPTGDASPAAAPVDPAS